MVNLLAQVCYQLLLLLLTKIVKYLKRRRLANQLAKQRQRARFKRKAQRHSETKREKASHLFVDLE